MKRKRSKKTPEITEKVLNDLKFRDFLEGLIDPNEANNAKKHGVLKWTPFHKQRKRGVFRENSE